MSHAPSASASLRRITLLVICTLILSSFSALAQSEKQKDKKPKSTQEPLSSPYRQWVNTDVDDIITPEERKTFLALKADEEREQFIANFWDRRNPDPDSEYNEFREEHYRRIAYANEHFSSGIPGSRTARGRMYIKFGKPDQIEAHPAGGSYNRPSGEGGGTTSTYPFEIWWYRYIEGVGSDVEIEFVDPTGSGEYRMANGPDDKDALLQVPGAGKTLAEILGISDKSERVVRGNRGGLFGPRVKDSLFDRLARDVDLQRAPRVKFNNSELLAFESDYPRVIYDRLPFSLGIDFVRATETSVITSFSVQLENAELVYRDVGGIQQAKANIYARLTKVSGQRVSQFEDVVISSYPPEALSHGQQARSIYQKKLVLAPGTYKIELVVSDVTSGRKDIIRQGFAVPKYPEGELSSSTLMLASRLEPLSGTTSTGVYVYGSLKVIPNVTGMFRPDQSLGVYMQVYNVALDQATLRPSLEVEYVITQKGREIARLKEDGKDSFSRLSRQQVMLARRIPLKELKPGFYELEVRVTDHVAGQRLTRKEAFQILP
jgi:GWxTD domain-containing protein